MECVAIAGVGLIGGSFGLALRSAGYTGEILGISSPATIEQAVARGAVDRGVTLEEAAAAADVILLAQPISVILETIDRLVPLARPDCLITDAGSTKAEIVARGSRLPLFLGGHPMAGKELAGVAAAEASLFQGKTWVMVEPAEFLSTPLSGVFLDWLTRCGAVLRYMTAAEHDRTVAWTSHLPQIASTALASSLDGNLPVDQLVSVSGSGLRDMTRLACSTWPIWKDILQTNTASIEHVLSVYIDKLTEIRNNLQTQRTGENFRIAAELAYKIRRGPDNS